MCFSTGSQVFKARGRPALGAAWPPPRNEPRLFFFGDGEFEGEAKVLDISTNGCKATSLTEVKIGLSLKLSLFLEMNSDGCGLITPSCDGSTVNVLGWNSRASDLLNARGFG